MITTAAAKMHEYTIPSLAAYHKRKLFHSNERNQVIDKFISGLDYETFLKYSERTTLTIDDVHSIGLDDRDCCKIEYENTTCDLDNSVNVEIKLEVSKIQ